eukprot:Em1193g2a
MGSIPPISRRVGGAESPRPTGLTGTGEAESSRPASPRIDSPRPSGLTVTRDVRRAMDPGPLQQAAHPAQRDCPHQLRKPHFIPLPKAALLALRTRETTTDQASQNQLRYTCNVSHAEQHMHEFLLPEVPGVDGAWDGGGRASFTISELKFSTKRSRRTILSSMPPAAASSVSANLGRTLDISHRQSSIRRKNNRDRHQHRTYRLTRGDNYAHAGCNAILALRPINLS